jgi:hypothetical protein
MRSAARGVVDRTADAGIVANMSKPAPLTAQERADLVAYLDGELTGEPARALEAKLNNSPEARAEADSLRLTWDLLDYLPQPAPSTSFTERTLSRLAPLREESKPSSKRLRPLLLGLGWAAVLLLSALGGYLGFRLVTRSGRGEHELVRDLRVIENKRYYDPVDDLDFLRKLDDPDLFGEESSR